jgi:activator of 2-hydroxyglutaryl-CoA dehydratase
MKNTNLVAGLDIGSRSIELALLEGDRLVDWAKVPTTFDPLAQCRQLLKGVTAETLVTTGYGRKLAQEHLQGRGAKAITEIQAYALGARHLAPEARTVLDIGGQDTKVITLNPAGKVASFALNADKRIQISSMCTVFAESEATSLMARGESPVNIAMGLHLAIVQRTLAMLRRVGEEPPLLFAGGVAHNVCVRALLEEGLGQDVIVPANPDLVGALGAALYGRNHAAPSS